MTAEPRGSDALETRIGYAFRDKGLLGRALAHSSAADARTSNERLEFLGDRVLGLIVAATLYRRYPDATEGELARRFVQLTRSETLAEVGHTIGLSAHVVTAAGSADVGTVNVVADACEALIAAIYLDGGMAAAEAFVARHWDALIDLDRPPPKDAKTRLQEWTQERGQGLPAYAEAARSGPDHALTFEVSVSIKGEPPAVGTGASKRAAEQAAAAALLARLETGTKR